MFAKSDDDPTKVIMNNCKHDITKCKSINAMIQVLNTYNKYKITELKNWIKEKNVWDELLYNELRKNNIYTIDELYITRKRY